MNCQECERLERQEEIARKSLSEQRALNIAEGRRGAPEKRHEQELQEQYDYAGAKRRRHEATHTGESISAKDFDILARHAARYGVSE